MKPIDMKSISFVDQDVQECPYEAYELLREEAPVWQDPGTGFYVITKYKDLKYILNDHEVFSKDLSGEFDEGIEGIGSFWRHPKEAEAIFEKEGWAEDSPLVSSPPLHTKYRKVIDPAFRQSYIREMEPHIKTLINSLIDRWIDNGEIEFVNQFCEPLPIHVMMNRLGFPIEDFDRIKAWSEDQIAKMGQSNTLEEDLACAHRLVAFQHYLAEKFEEKRKSPKDDIMTLLVTAQLDEGRELNMQELISITMTLNVGGNETTSNAIATAMKILMEQPETLAQLQADPALIKPFIEEVVRLDSPAQSLLRIVRKDCELQGVSIPKGAIIDLRFASANHDVDEFKCPADVDLHRRNPGKHMGYGSGAHHCVGAPLARQEMLLSLEILLKRLTNIQLAPGKNDFTHHPNFAVRGLKHLHLTFEKA